MVTVLPAIAATVAFACAVTTGLGAYRRPRPDQVIWTIAFIVFAIAAGAEVVGAVVGWSPALARVYYLAGAVLVVGLLALGELYLLMSGRLPAITPGVTLLVVALATTLVWSAPIRPDQLQTEGWNALERGPALVAMTVGINAGGTAILVGGALFSTITLRQSVSQRRRAIGCALIASGTIVVAAGGTLTRLGEREFLYVALAVGVSIIFTGITLTRSPHAASAQDPLSAGAEAVPGPRLLRLPAPVAPSNVPHPGIAFVQTAIATRSGDELAAYCQRWSATPVGDGNLSREQARQVWALRLALPETQREAFDVEPLAVQAQLAELYFAVWTEDPAQSSSQSRA